MPLPPSYTLSNIPPSCCTCAVELLSNSEKKLTTNTDNRQLSCCHRFICGKCIDVSCRPFQLCREDNPRFATYCPFCQTTSSKASPFGISPPPYSPRDLQLSYPEKAVTPPLDSFFSTDSIIHFIHPNETLPGIALAYGIPLQVLRKHNTLFADHLLPARRFLLIPRSHYAGPSLSPSPVKPPEIESQQIMLKRFQIQTKCVEYALAEWYLKDSKWDFDSAVEKWELDEEWEKKNHLKKGKEGYEASRFGRESERLETVTKKEKLSNWGLRGFGY